MAGCARPRRLDQLPGPTAEQDLGRPFEAKTSGTPKIDAALSAYPRGRRYCLSSFVWDSPRGYRITSYTVDAAAGTRTDDVGSGEGRGTTRALLPGRRHLPPRR